MIFLLPYSIFAEILYNKRNQKNMEASHHEEIRD